MSGVIKKSITLLTAIIPDEEKRNGVQLKLAESLTFLFKQCIDCFQVLLNMVSSKNNETKKFRLGLTLMQLGLSLRDNLLVHKNALPIMEKLVKKTKKSVYLTVPEGDEGVLIDRVDADLLFKISEPIVDENTVMHRWKKVILAHMNSKTKKQIIRNLISIDKVNDLKWLEDELQNIKKCGIAMTFEQTKKGIVSIATPIFSWEDKVVASISVVCFKTEFTGHQAKYIISETKRAAEEISEELGWIKPR